MEGEEKERGKTQQTGMMLQEAAIVGSSPVLLPLLVPHPTISSLILTERVGIATTTNSILVSKSGPTITASSCLSIVVGRKAKGREGVSWESEQLDVSEKSEVTIDREIGLTSSSSSKTRRSKEGEEPPTAGVGNGSLGLMQELQYYHHHGQKQQHQQQHQQQQLLQQLHQNQRHQGGALINVPSSSKNNARQVSYDDASAPHRLIPTLF